VKLRGKIRAPLVVIILYIVVIPAAQLLIGNPDSVVWQWVLYVLTGVSLLLFLIFPWLGAQWARKLRKELIAEFPQAIVSIVTVEISQKAYVKLMLVEVRGITVFGPSRKVETFLRASSIANIFVKQKGRSAREYLVIASDDGFDDQEFQPQGNQGVEALTSLALSEFRDSARRKIFQ
jgi:hypothetical protein